MKSLGPSRHGQPFEGAALAVDDRGLQGKMAQSPSGVESAALLDRLLHRCHIVNIHGNSCRMRRLAQLSKAIHPIANRLASESHAAGDGVS